MAVIKRIKKKEETSTNKTEMENMQLEFYRIKVQGKLLKKREDELKKKLDDYMAKVFKPDAKGHYLFTTLDEQGNKIHLQKQARKSISLNEERAKAYLAEHGLYEKVIVEKDVVAPEVTEEQIIEILYKHVPDFVIRVETIDENSLEQLVTNEEIPMDEFEEICDINITYAMTFIDDKKFQQEGEVNATKGERKKV